MAILRPFDTARELLAEAEVDLKALPPDPKEAAKEALNRNGAGISDAARAIAEELDNEKTKLAAAKLVMEMHGAITKDQKSSVPSVNIQIVGAGNTLIEMVTPR